MVNLLIALCNYLCWGFFECLDISQEEKQNFIQEKEILQKQLKVLKV